ncbi:hypothetical protein C4G95_RS15980 [Vibrio parahaemolyticus]|nr:hypothetical protein [Vibrio parahaemolyticus]
MRFRLIIGLILLIMSFLSKATNVGIYRHVDPFTNDETVSSFVSDNIYREKVTAMAGLMCTNGELSFYFRLVNNNLIGLEGKSTKLLIKVEDHEPITFSDVSTYQNDSEVGYTNYVENKEGFSKLFKQIPFARIMRVRVQIGSKKYDMTFTSILAHLQMFRVAEYCKINIDKFKPESKEVGDFTVYPTKSVIMSTKHPFYIGAFLDLDNHMRIWLTNFSQIDGRDIDYSGSADDFQSGGKLSAEFQEDRNNKYSKKHYDLILNQLKRGRFFNVLENQGDISLSGFSKAYEEIVDEI